MTFPNFFGPKVLVTLSDLTFKSHYFLLFPLIFGLHSTCLFSYLSESLSVPPLRGPGGGGLHQDFLEIEYLVVSDREELNSYQKLFTKLKNIALSLKYCWSKVSAVV